jgi:WD40 repeat protein
MNMTPRFTALAFSDRYSLLMSASADGVIKIWNINNVSCIKTIQDKEVTCLQTLPCFYLASVSSGKIKLWNLLDYQCINILEGSGDEVNSLLFRGVYNSIYHFERRNNHLEVSRIIFILFYKFKRLLLTYLKLF